MVDACCQKIDSWSDDWRLAMDWTVGSYEERSQRSLWNKVDFRRFKSKSHLPAEFIPSKIKKRLGIVSRDEIDIVLDISGFGYSDQWGVEFAKIMADRSIVRSQKGERYILLPQAYGPFKNNKLADVAKSYFDRSEVLYVRDKVSLEYMQKLMGADERLRLFPDFTCLVKGYENVSPTKREYMCVVPNCRMIDPRHGKQGSEYLGSLIHAIEFAFKKGVQPIIINHEGVQDLEIVKELKKKSKCEVVVINGGSSRYLKAIFKNALFVLGSRFHALISSLTQGVPCIGMGWSHKYEELFSDFGIKEYLVEVKGDGVLRCVDSLLDVKCRERVIEHINKGVIHYNEKAETMWSEIQTLMLR